MDILDIIEQRNALMKIVAELYSEATITNTKSFRKAQEALKSKEFQYFSRKELDKMLPINLRKNEKLSPRQKHLIFLHS